MTEKQYLKFNIHFEPIGIIREVCFKLVKIPKPKYSKLVKNKKIGDQMWFKEPYDRKAFSYKFGRKKI